MIFAAGLGTRLKPITDHMPKAMVSVGGEPLIKHVIEKLKSAGTERIVVNVHHFATQITDYLKENNNFNTDIRISDESDNLFDKEYPILIHNVDILSNVDLKRFYEAGISNSNMESTTVDAVLLVSERKTKRYLLFDNSMRLVGWTNIETGEVRSPYPNLNPKDCKMYAFAGIHTISPRLFEMMDEDFPDKFGIIDFYLKACKSHIIKGYVKEDLKLLDVGKLDTLKEAEDFVQTRES